MDKVNRPYHGVFASRKAAPNAPAKLFLDTPANCSGFEHHFDFFATDLGGNLLDGR